MTKFRTMTPLFLLLVTAVWEARADFNTFILENLNVNYTRPQGNATIDKMLYPDAGYAWDTTQNINILKNGTDFILDNGREQFVVNNAPDLVQSTEQFDLESLNIHSEGNQVSVRNDRMFFHSPNSDLEVTQFSLDCTEGLNQEEYSFSDKIYEGCLTTSTLDFTKYMRVSRDNGGQKINDLSQTSVQKLIEALIRSAQQKNHLAPTGQSADSVTTIRNFHMAIQDHQLSLKAKVEASYSGNVKVRGMAWYVYPAKEAKVQLDKVTFGWFNVTEEVFQQLEQDTSGKIRVERPFVYLKL